MSKPPYYQPGARLYGRSDFDFFTEIEDGEKMEINGKWVKELPACLPATRGGGEWLSI